FEVLKAMDDEREDLGSYVNLFGYNPKYGVSGRRIVGVRYEPQSFSKGLTRPEQTLPARVARR
ncbi:MAG: 3'-5' exonuclease, partial [Clostridiales bacterium]